MWPPVRRVWSRRPTCRPVWPRSTPWRPLPSSISARPNRNWYLHQSGANCIASGPPLLRHPPDAQLVTLAGRGSDAPTRWSSPSDRHAPDCARATALGWPNLEGTTELFGPAAQVREPQGCPVLEKRRHALAVVGHFEDHLAVDTQCHHELGGFGVLAGVGQCLAQHGQEMVGDVLGEGRIDGAVEDHFGT